MSEVTEVTESTDTVMSELFDQLVSMESLKAHYDIMTDDLTTFIIHISPKVTECEVNQYTYSAMSQPDDLHQHCMYKIVYRKDLITTSVHPYPNDAEKRDRALYNTLTYKWIQDELPPHEIIPTQNDIAVSIAAYIHSTNQTVFKRVMDQILPNVTAINDSSCPACRLKIIHQGHPRIRW
jgi:hypothetical protein